MRFTCEIYFDEYTGVVIHTHYHDLKHSAHARTRECIQLCDYKTAISASHVESMHLCTFEKSGEAEQVAAEIARMALAFVRSAGAGGPARKTWNVEICPEVFNEEEEEEATAAQALGGLEGLFEDLSVSDNGPTRTACDTSHLARRCDAAAFDACSEGVFLGERPSWSEDLQESEWPKADAHALVYVGGDPSEYVGTVLQLLRRGGVRVLVMDTRALGEVEARQVISAAEHKGVAVARRVELEPDALTTMPCEVVYEDDEQVRSAGDAVRVLLDKRAAGTCCNMVRVMSQMRRVHAVEVQAGDTPLSKEVAKSLMQVRWHVPVLIA